MWLAIYVLDTCVGDANVNSANVDFTLSKAIACAA